MKPKKALNQKQREAVKKIRNAWSCSECTELLKCKSFNNQRCPFFVPTGKACEDSVQAVMAKNNKKETTDE